MILSEYFPIWSKLTGKEKELLESNSFVKHVKKGDVVHGGGNECTGLLLVARGQLRAYCISDEGKEISVYRLFERDMCLFSASCIMNSIQFEITIEAERDSELFVISPDAYKKLMNESVVVANYTSEIMATRFSEVMWLIEQVLWKSFDKRLADFLLSESDIEGSDVLKITHETIGNHLGNPREVVTRMLRYFQNEGMVKLTRGSIEITDREKLKNIK